MGGRHQINESLPTVVQERHSFRMDDASGMSDARDGGHVCIYAAEKTYKHVTVYYARFQL